MREHTQSSNDDDMDMIDGYLAHLADKGRSPDTIDLRRKILTKLHRDLPRGVGRACGAELDAWIDAQQSPNTRATYWVAIRGAYKFWTDPADPWLDSNPTDTMTARTFPQGQARPGKEEQLLVVLEHGADPYRLWAVLAAYQGLRCCEIAGLDREHITRDTLMVMRGKGGDPRVCDTDPLVWDLVRDLPRGPIARNAAGTRRATKGEVSKRANYHFRQLGLEGLTMHMWRHRMGVQMQRTYRNIRVTQKALGHKWLTSTQIYTDATLDELREARAMLPRPHAA